MLRTLIFTVFAISLVACGRAPSDSEIQAVNTSSSPNAQASSSLGGKFTITVAGFGNASYSYDLIKNATNGATFRSQVVSADPELKNRVTGDNVILNGTGNTFSNQDITVTIDSQTNTSRVTAYFGQQISAASRAVTQTQNQAAQQQINPAVNQTGAASNIHPEGQINLSDKEIEDLYLKNCPDLYDTTKDTECSFQHNGKSFGGSSSSPITDAEWEKIKQEDWYEGSDLQRDEDSGVFDRPHQ